MKIGTVKGTSDYLPKETTLREFIQNSILDTYKSNGFERIITPVLEDIENLDKSEGGENLNLIFKILKRGEKLNNTLETLQFDELADMGLRYDLTLPLSRYYANNRMSLVIPFKCIQVGNVYRAEKPQKGRMRELVQCDIDIVGSDSIYCEIELINVTAKALLNLGLKGFKIRINDRRILKDVLQSIGFEQNELDSVCISFDKLEKIGVGGIRNELSEKGFSTEKINAFTNILQSLPVSLEYIKSMSIKTEYIDNLAKIISEVEILSENKYTIEFDLSLVRGQGYYTGAVFEIESSDFNSSIAGGGRYNNLIGKFVNESIPAVGFSIGFERIYSILKDNNFDIPYSRKKIAIFFENDFIGANKLADEMRIDYDITLFEKPKKLNKFLNSLQSSGYYGFIVSDQSQEIKVLK